MSHNGNVLDWRVQAAAELNASPSCVMDAQGQVVTSGNFQVGFALNPPVADLDLVEEVQQLIVEAGLVAALGARTGSSSYFGNLFVSFSGFGMRIFRLGFCQSAQAHSYTVGKLACANRASASAKFRDRWASAALESSSHA